MADPYVDGLSLPIGANPETDIVIGQGDYGNVYRTRDGQVYQIVPQAVQGGSRIKPVLNALGADPWGTAKTVGNALAGKAARITDFQEQKLPAKPCRKT